MTFDGNPATQNVTPSEHSAKRIAGPRLVAIIGPFQSGKTTLLDCLLARSGALARQGSVRDGSSVGDFSPEARAHAASVEANIASTDYLGDRFTFIDLPGSPEFFHEARNILPFCDAAIVVCEADERKLPALRMILRELEELELPRFLFLNKIDQANLRIRETLAMLQPASRTPLLLRQIPIWQNGIVTGFIDLALERAFVYREHAPSEVVDLPAGDMPREKEARYAMLEKLADYDDDLMEELLLDIEPPRDKIFDDLTQDLRDGAVVPVLIGSAEAGHGVTRVLKALRHEAPGVARLRQRLGLAENGPALARALKTIQTAHGGKLSFARVLRGGFKDGASVRSAKGEDRIAGLSRLTGAAFSKQPEVLEGDCVAFGRLDHVATGDSFGEAKAGALEKFRDAAEPPAPVHALALIAHERKDETRLSAAIAKLIDEDPGLAFVQDQESGELRLAGQGEMHLRVALERLAARYGVTVETRKPAVRYRETIHHAVSARGRHKKQSGGHGQFGDVAIEIAPLPRGKGFEFSEAIHGGAVPKNFFPAIEAGAREALEQGPLGFPVVDVAVKLTDGSFHSVDSSDQAFRAAARLAVSEALAKAGPALLEPILAVDLFLPSDALARVSALVAGRRGQILGYDARPGWEGWEKLDALIPAADIDNLIVDLRSATAGVGGFVARFDHLAELSGKPAEAVIAHHKGEKAAAQ